MEDSFGNATNITDALTNSTAIVRDDNGLVLSSTNPDGQVSAAIYTNGDTTATFNGQVLAPDESDSMTFSGLAPNAARTYGIYAQYTGTAPELDRDL